jgi:hypothetical protein
MRTDIDAFFAAAGLAAPASLSELRPDDVRTWLEVRMDGATYLPGSTVHLTVTSSPIVIASATVARDGTVQVTGTMPIELLGVGLSLLAVGLMLAVRPRDDVRDPSTSDGRVGSVR